MDSFLLLKICLFFVLKLTKLETQDANPLIKKEHTVTKERILALFSINSGLQIRSQNNE